MRTFNVPFIKYQHLFIAVSVLLFVASVLIIAKNGLNYGIDFKGGAKLLYHFQTSVSETKLRDALSTLDLGDVSVVRFGEARENRMYIKVELPEEHAKIGDEVSAALEAALGKGSFTLEQEETVGPRVGKEMRTKAMYTILFSWLLMLIYIGYRFDFLFAPGAVIALVHDTVITVGALVLLNKEINLTILAAILTLIGFSINDTIVIFDRIRENMSRINPNTINDVVNESVNSTLSRTIITTLTVLFVVIVLFIAGGGVLHDFAFAMIVGVIAGSYSTIFIASPVYIALYNKWPRIRKLWAKR